MVDMADGRNQMAFNPCTGTHAVPVIDLHSERDTGRNGDRLSGLRKRTESGGQKKSEM